MTTELTKAAQQALEALKNVTDYDQINAARRALQSALTQRPAAQTERDTGPRVLREVFALCEDTMDKMAAESTEFSRGRAFEANGISRAIGTWFQDEYCGRSYMGEPSLPAPQQATPEPSRGMIGMGAHALANDLAQAVAQDDADPDGHDMSAGLFGPNVSAWLRKVATEYLSQPATPEPVGGHDMAVMLERGAKAWAGVDPQDLRAGPTPEPVGEPNEMESAWCWWVGDGERFHIVDTESEAHGEAQCHIDDDCDPGQTHEYSVARVQHPLDALGMDWLALHVAESIAENVCCWCDDNTGAEEPSIMLSPDDSKSLGVMVATFLRQRVGVEWWTADQKTVTVHTYVSGSNDNPALAAAQAKGGEHG